MIDLPDDIGYLLLSLAESVRHYTRSAQYKSGKSAKLVVLTPTERCSLLRFRIGTLLKPEQQPSLLTPQARNTTEATTLTDLARELAE